MSSDNMNYFTKESLDTYLKALAKTYRKSVGKNMPAEIILIGGAAIVANYGFRDMTTDVDAIIRAASAMKDAINTVGDTYNLPNGWLNDDFKNTDSFSQKLVQYSVPYKIFSGSLYIRTVSAEYLVAMKLRSGRKYKKDLSDIVGILAEHQERGTPLTMEQIRRAVAELYSDWNVLPEDSRQFVEDTLHNGDYRSIYKAVEGEELRSKELLVKFEEDYPGAAKAENVDNILKTLKKRREQER